MVTTSPDLKGRSTIMKTPAARFASRPDQAIPIAMPAAARIPAKVKVWTPKTPRTVMMRSMLSRTLATECR
jgi:hypothetical protein